MGALEGFGVLVTGGGSGIGEACAAVLARDGAVVTICGRTQSKLDEAAERMRGKIAGAVVHTVAADVVDEEQVRAAVAQAAEAAGALHAVVGSAGGSLHMGPLVLADAAAVRATIDLNMMGTFLTLKHAAPELGKTSGSYVAISSHVGVQSERFLGAYASAKAGLDQIVRVSADELGPSGVRVNSVRPGIIATELMDAITAGGPVLDSYHANIPLAASGTPDDVAALVRFLAGPESSFITGQCIGVDGGQTLRSGADFSAFAEPLYRDQPGWSLVAKPEA